MVTKSWSGSSDWPGMLPARLLFPMPEVSLAEIIGRLVLLVEVVLLEIEVLLELEAKANERLWL